MKGLAKQFAATSVPVGFDHKTITHDHNSQNQDLEVQLKVVQNVGGSPSKKSKMKSKTVDKIGNNEILNIEYVSVKK